MAIASTPQERHSLSRNLIGTSPAFAQQLARLQRFAGCDAGVLILGETGTGKELFAQSIHYASPRAGRPMVAVNCGAVPAELVESELFGHVRGAYTTAVMARSGLVREAEGGSLFLDDVDCLPLAAQAKLLRFLQEREYRAVGSNAVQHADVRVIAASNRDLAQMASRGEFRADLYYRLHVLSMHLPPLRERREDIAALAMHFVRHFSRRLERPVDGFTPAALRRLLSHGWPGNVRELQHAIERAVLMCGGPTLDADDLELDLPAAEPAASSPGFGTGRTSQPSALSMSASGLPADPWPSAGSFSDETFRVQKARVVDAFERGYLEHLLAATQGNVARAALAAGKDRRALFELMRKHRILAQRFRPSAR